MYEITCPSCGSKKKASFARVGAVVRCSHCKKPIRLDPSNTRRIEPKKPAKDGGAAAKMLDERKNEQATRKAGEQAREVVGLSGLSELMAQSSGTTSAVEPGEAGSGKHEQDAPHEHAGWWTASHRPQGKRMKKSKRKRKKSNSSGLMWLLMALVFIPLIAIGVILFSRNALSTLGWEAGENPQAWAASSLPEVEPVALVPWDWQDVDEVFSAGRQITDMIRVAPPKGYDGTNFPERMLVGTVHDSSVLVQGRARVAVVDANGQAVAQTYVPLVGVSRNELQPVLLAIPRRYQQKGYSVREASVEDAQISSDARMLADWQIQTFVVGEGPDAAIRLVLEHHGDQPAKNLIATIAAQNEAGQPVRRWVLQWHETLESGESVNFWARVPAPKGLGVTHWKVTAIACPEEVKLTAIPKSSNAPLPGGDADEPTTGPGSRDKNDPEFFGIGVDEEGGQ